VSAAYRLAGPDFKQIISPMHAHKEQLSSGFWAWREGGLDARG
jgi:hypothetical protein